MKHWLTLASLILLGGMAHAQQIVYSAPPSTGTYSSVFVSSQTPTRVDNLDKGTASVLPNRTAIVLAVPASGKVNCGFDVSVSTIPPSLTVSSPKYGVEYTAGVYQVPLPSNMSYYCLSASVSAGQAMAAQQVSPFKPGSRSIPGSP